MKTKPSYLPLLIVFIYFLIHGDLYAQLLYGLTSKTKKNALSISNGFSGQGPVYTVSYARGIHLKIFKIIDDDLTLFSDLTDRFNLHGNNHFQFVYGGQGYIFHKGNFKILFRKTLLITRVNTLQANATYFGAELELMPGIYKDKYFLAMEVYYGDSYKGFIRPKYGNHFQLDNIGNGWIKPHMGTLQFGPNVGIHIRHHLCFYGYINVLAVKPHRDLYVSSLLYGGLGANYLF